MDLSQTALGRGRGHSRYRKRSASSDLQIDSFPVRWGDMPPSNQAAMVAASVSIGVNPAQAYAIRTSIYKSATPWKFEAGIDFFRTEIMSTYRNINDLK